jgi:hypothetical protein
VWGQYHASIAFIPGKNPVPIVQEAGWAPEAVRISAENLASPGFDPRTFQPVTSLYTDYAIPAPICVSEEKNLTPRDETKIYEIQDSDCVTKRTTETNMQDVPCAAAIVSAGRYYTHQSLTKSAELPSVPLLREQSHTAMDICRGFTLPTDGSLYKYCS